MRRRARTFGRAWGRRAARWHVLGDAPCLPRGLKRGPSAVEAVEGEKRVREEGNDAGKEVWNRAFNARAARGYRIHGVATRAARQQSNGGFWHSAQALILTTPDEDAESPTKLD